jgi:hypothetical protein
MMWYGWRGARMPFHVLAILWTSTLTVRLINGVIAHGQQMRFRGDTLGIYSRLCAVYSVNYLVGGA